MASNPTTTTESDINVLHQAVGSIDLDNPVVYDQFKDALRSDDVRKTALNEIRDLNNTVHSIQETFLKIRKDLLRFDQAGFRGQDGIVLQLSPEWDQLYQVCGLLRLWLLMSSCSLL